MNSVKGNGLIKSSDLLTDDVTWHCAWAEKWKWWGRVRGKRKW